MTGNKLANIYLYLYVEIKINMSNCIETDNAATVEAFVEVQLIKDGDYIVSYCPALELSSFGNDEEDAKQGFEEALSIFIDELHKRGTLEKVLLNLGWGLRKLPVASFVPPEEKYLKAHPLTVNKTFSEKVLIPVY
jgi:predicted RNase H-like HicB family nuclease